MNKSNLNTRLLDRLIIELRQFIAKDQDSGAEITNRIEELALLDLLLRIEQGEFNVTDLVVNQPS